MATCVSWPYPVPELSQLIDKRKKITRRTFLKHVDPSDLTIIAESLGYATHPSQGLTMAADWHVEYFKSSWRNKTVYGFRHSAIEHIFVEH
jgi:hypothetical protein